MKCITINQPWGWAVTCARLSVLRLPIEPVGVVSGETVAVNLRGWDAGGFSWLRRNRWALRIDECPRFHALPQSGIVAMFQFVRAVYEQYRWMWTVDNVNSFRDHVEGVSKKGLFELTRGTSGVVEIAASRSTGR